MFPYSRIFATTFYTVGCALSMFANGFPLLIVSRIIQAIGAGILLPLVIFRLYPKDQRGELMGIVGLVLCAGPGLGQMLSGLLIDSFGWRSIFLTFGTIALGIYGVASMMTIIPLAIGAFFLVLFVIRQLSIEYPLLELKVFKNRNFATAVIYIAFVYGIVIASATLSSVYIQTARHISATIYALAILPNTLILAVLNPITGHILDKRGPFILSIAGTFLLTCGSFLMSRFGANTSLLYFIIAIMSGTAHCGNKLDYIQGIDTAFIVSAIIFLIAMILPVFLIPRKNEPDCQQ